MKRNTLALVLPVAAVGLGCLAWYSATNRPSASLKVGKERIEADSARATGDLTAAKTKLESLIAKNEASPDPEVQDQVTAAKISLGYVHAQAKDFVQARAVLQQAASTYKGTGKMDADFGRLDDQAAYQAVAALQGDGKLDQAREELLRFIKERPLSPLVYGAHKRLLLIIPKGGDRKPYDDALEVAVQKQQAKARHDMAMCGPKAAAYWLKQNGKPVDPEDLAKDAGTTDDGTTLDGLKKALGARGVDTAGYTLNRQDFAKAKTPFLWLSQDHYVTVLTVAKDKAKVYDPLTDSERDVRLPAPDEPTFTATVLMTASLEILK